MDAKIVVDIPGIAEPVGFESASELHKFAERERDIWQKWAAGIAPLEPQVPSCENTANAIFGAWADVATQLLSRLGTNSSPDTSGALSVFREWAKRTKVVASTSPLGSTILAIESAPGSAALAVLALSEQLRNQLQHVERQTQLWRAFCQGLPTIAGTIRSREFVGAAKKDAAATWSAKEAAESTAKAIRELETSTKQECEVHASRAKSDLEKLIRNARRATEHAIADSRSEWASLVRTYDLKLKTRAPYIYWRTKERQHRKLAKSWMEWLVLTFIVAVIWLSVATWMVKDMTSSGALPWLVQAVSIGVPAFIALWLARLCGRQLSSHLLRAEDARERSAMVKTLLALTRQDNSAAVAGDAQVTIALTALFRAGPGFDSDDSPAVSLLDALMRSGQSKSS